jgi:hypothetical protein
MYRRVGILVLCLVVQACSQIRTVDSEGALFSSLFDAPYGTCRQLRAELRTEIEALKIAKKKADDDFVASEAAPPPAAKSPRPPRKEDPLAALREYSKRSQQAEKLNEALKERSCRTVDLETALKAP